MPLLKRLKDRLLGDSRMTDAIGQFQEIYRHADDAEAFHAALAEGDISRAAEVHQLSEEELEHRIDDLYAAGIDLAEEYPEANDTKKDAFTEA